MVPIVEAFYRVPGAPRLALLADLHDIPFDRVAASLRARRPALVCVAGDLLRGPGPQDGRSPLEAQANVLPFLRACAELAPTFLSLGNHDQCLDADDLALIRATGATLLDNGWVRRGGLAIGGLTSGAVLARRSCRPAPGQPPAPGPERRGARVARLPDTAWLPAFAAAPGFHILLSHHPEYFPHIPGSVELVLSGHAHGGQWRFYNPIRRRWTGVYAPGQGLWPRWTRGLYDGRLVVSAGLANPTPIPRLFNPPEVVYVEG